jgi:hypothetical protein
MKSLIFPLPSSTTKTFFLEEDLLKLDAFLYALSDKGLVDNEWSPIKEQD